MHCTVHCLISRDEELQPLIDRVARAGIAEEDVHVVRRGALQPRSCRPADAGQTEWPAWNVFLAPATFWWCFAANSWTPEPSSPLSRGRVTALAGCRRTAPRRQPTEN